jgi:hypothetical protein
MLYFFPPFYLLHVAVGLFYKLFTVGGYDGENDLELFDLFFRPWNIYGDHPLTFRRSIEQQVEAGELYPGSGAIGTLKVGEKIAKNIG